VKNGMKALLMLAMLALSFLPVLAQDDIAPIQVEITGLLTYEDVNSDGAYEILVGGIVIIPPMGFDANLYPPGQIITVTGSLGDDDTIEAMSFVVEPPTTATPEATAEATESAPQSEDEQERAEEEREREAERQAEEQEREAERQAEEQEREAERQAEEQEREAEQREREEERNEGQGDDREVVEIVGAIETVAQNYIVVDGVTIEGGGTFQPGQMDEGQHVRVTGVYENNGRLRADTFEEISAEEAAALAMAEATPEATPEVDLCVPETHPVVETLALEFDLDSITIIQLHCAGSGFGDVARALLLSAETGEAPETYLGMVKTGQSWGDITRNAGFELSDVAPDRVLGGS
jgi:hypothetical protein